ncbi:hypothetical protein HG536_0C00780 [Torulaspora globosa]|uniref:Succinate dehydrogenase [ubiquinone] cytochrome b small subunit n=1 Tax=Torulaspora globosa TaxID=48254 RepID=A0A7G3ZEH5_9SACH|nr:uncharacterized protein HG536_0C00780 [Torulaspora globosa]QLL31911.1 hypothetical protein HG536_0C00780 [Torulaspora globosa]
MFLQRSVLLGRSVASCGLQRTATRAFTIPFLSKLPQKAGGVEGTPNDAYVPPAVDKMHGSYHWDFERALAVAMVPLAVTQLASGGSAPQVADAVLASVLLGHVYIGFQSCIIDYIPRRVYGRNYNYAMYLLTLGSVFSAVGIYKLETEENGVIGVLTSLWKAGSGREEKKDA